MGTERGGQRLGDTLSVTERSLESAAQEQGRAAPPSGGAGSGIHGSGGQRWHSKLHGDPRLRGCTTPASPAPGTLPRLVGRRDADTDAGMLSCLREPRERTACIQEAGPPERSLGSGA